MRTTVTIDDDLLGEVRDKALNEDVPLKQMLNHVLRVGLERSRGKKLKKPYRCKTFSMGYPPLYNLEKALLVADALEDEEILRKLSVRK
jgi:hypothetical protein